MSAIHVVGTGGQSSIPQCWVSCARAFFAMNANEYGQTRPAAACQHFPRQNVRIPPKRGASTRESGHCSGGLIGVRLPASYKEPARSLPGYMYQRLPQRQVRHHLLHPFRPEPSHLQLGRPWHTAGHRVHFQRRQGLRRVVPSVCEIMLGAACLPLRRIPGRVVRAPDEIPF